MEGKVNIEAELFSIEDDSIEWLYHDTYNNE